MIVPAGVDRSLKVVVLFAHPPGVAGTKFATGPTMVIKLEAVFVIVHP